MLFSHPALSFALPGQVFTWENLYDGTPDWRECSLAYPSGNGLPWALGNNGPFCSVLEGDFANRISIDSNSQPWLMHWGGTQPPPGGSLIEPCELTTNGLPVADWAGAESFYRRGWLITKNGDVYTNGQPALGPGPGGLPIQLMCEEQPLSWLKVNSNPFPGSIVIATGDFTGMDSNGYCDFGGILYALDSNGDVYKLPRFGEVWPPMTWYGPGWPWPSWDQNKINNEPFPFPYLDPEQAIDIAVDSFLPTAPPYVLAKSGNIYYLNASGNWIKYNITSYSGPGFPQKISIGIGGPLFMMDSLGDIYEVTSATYQKINNQPYPGTFPVDFVLTAPTIWNPGRYWADIIDGGPAGILEVKVFNDLNGDGKYDPGEEFNDFNSQFAEISLDGNPITEYINKTGYYRKIISLADHYLTINPDEGNGWFRTKYSWTGTCLDGCDYIPNDEYSTTPFSVVEGGLRTVYLGIKQNSPPQVTLDLLAPSKSPDCQSPVLFLFKWQVTDSENNDLTWFFQVDEEPADWNNLAVNKNGSVSSPYPRMEQTIPVYEASQPNSLLFGKTYAWRVKAIDDQGADSGWVYGQEVITPSAPPPDPSFQCEKSGGEWFANCSLVKISPGQTVYFRNPIAGYDLYEWDFNDDSVFDATGSEVSSPFSGGGPYEITHQVTDNGIPCSSTQNLGGLLSPLPIWIEIAPF